MCEPTMIMMGLSAAASAASAKEKQNLQIQANENQADSLIKDYNYSQKNLENEAISERDAAENALFNSNIEAVKARSSARAQSGSMGITGNTVAAKDQNMNAEIGRSNNDIERNFNTNLRNMQSSSDSGYRSLTSALTGLREEGIAGPGALDTALSVGSAAYQGYNADKTQKAALKNGYK